MSSCLDTAYVYTAFSKPRSIRLLHIQDDDRDDSINAELITVNIDEQPRYVALSYVWGAEQPSFQISIGQKLFTVRRNAFNALLRLKKRHSFVLWIDAICINQGDWEERAHQVGIMGDIYAMASEVPFYLGEYTVKECLQIDSLMDMLFQYALGIPNPDEQLRDVNDMVELQRLGIPDHRDERWQHFVRLLRHPWFSRVWTIQESALAMKGVFLYGGSELPQGKLNLILNVMARFTSFPSSIDQTHPRALISAWQRCAFVGQLRQDMIAMVGDTIMVASHARKKCLMLLLLHQAGFSKASDPRDCVFALLGLSHEANEPALQPDYSEAETLERTYQRVAKFLVKKGYGAQLLRSVSPDAEDTLLPSWVPRWDRVPIGDFLGHQRRSLKHDLFTASRTTQSVFSLSNRDWILNTDGIVFDTITTLGCQTNALLRHAALPPEKNKGLNTYMCALAFIREIFVMLLPPGEYPTNEPVARVVCRTAVCDSLNGRDTTPSWVLPNLSEYVIKLTENLAKPNDLDETMNQLVVIHLKLILDYLNVQRSSESLARGNMYLRTVFDRMSGSLRCITSKGYVCVVPLASQSGDKIVLIQGCEVPYVIRRISETTHSIVGSCYVHGIMTGEGWQTESIQQISIR